MSPPYISDHRLEIAANQLLARYQKGHGMLDSPPVPVERIVEDTLDLNILWDVVEEPEGGTILAGLDPLRKRVVFNEVRRNVIAETPWLYNTILAHESGHWEVHVDKVSLKQQTLPSFDKMFSCLYRGDIPGQGSKEIQAHKVMGYLLMPTDLMYPAVQGIDLMDWRVLYQLRDLFQVTISALRVRLERLNLLYVADDGQLYPSRSEYEGQGRLLP